MTMMFFFLLADMFVARDKLARNWESLQRNGFSPANIVFNVVFMVVFSSFGTAATLALFFSPSLLSTLHWWPQSVSEAGRVLGGVVLVLIAVELSFGWIHKHVLHERFPSVHAFHHACFESTISTGLFFSPPDIAAKFGPVLLCALCAFPFDPRVTLLSMCVTFGWYFMDHDETWRLPHWYHHKFVSSYYAIYGWWRSPSEKDLIRKQLKRQ